MHAKTIVAARRDMCFCTQRRGGREDSPTGFAREAVEAGRERRRGRQGCAWVFRQNNILNIWLRGESSHRFRRLHRCCAVDVWT
ncbi:hypothetical protein HMPREF9136_2265 [Prevotella dentalis DSM 3688]|uniref:Uncharacterized protein n=1 Tax=Prevotella dentalis (strain ATCC 49559 / DSM 3688 / JCM 13448 / NCTC 12043 / ES 2772) TaxID=908937 RepID=F9D5Y7_PREDD|nr:hypothetical protein HMPREF9136_2265 [Prevotella dentalis DSM 3688]